MKKFIIIWILMALAVVGLSAADRQFYFVGKYERLGSLSSDAKDQKGIYLRWDLIEGNMPTEIKKISLVRVEDNSSETILLSSVPASTDMNASEIQALFGSHGSERRLMEAVDMISKNEGECSHAHLSNIGEKVHTCVSNKFWGFMASRINFDIARSRYRAYLDTDFSTTNSSIVYKLFGYSVTEESILLGQAEVPLKNKRVLAAKNFEQVVTSRCNDGRYALDDFRVALKWENGGDKTDQYANNIMVSGYDLYYSSAPADPSASVLPKVDIAELAAKLSHDSQGNVDLSSQGLTKANDILITLGSQAGEEGKPIYVEDVAELEKRGFKPGEKRYYFLVPRDFTGNYGPTVSLIVTIPDMLPPPMPFNPRVVEQVGSTGASIHRNAMLMWDRITPSEYARYYAGTMKACPGKIYNTDKRVRFVDKKASCSEGNGIIINFDIKRYNIYRFDNIQEAAAFRDSDMDGYGDIIEKKFTLDKEAKDAVCNSSEHPDGNEYKHLVYTVDAESTQRVMSFKDAGVSAGKVYWYRIAAVSEGVSKEEVIISSPMTAPIRAYMPKRALLPAPKIHYIVKKRLFIELNSSNEIEALAIDNADSVDIDIIKLRIAGSTYVLDREGKNFLAPDTFWDTEVSSSTRTVGVSFYQGSKLIKSQTYWLEDLFSVERLDYSTEKEKSYSLIIRSKVKTAILQEKSESTREDGEEFHGSGIQVRSQADGESNDTCIELGFGEDYYGELIENNGTIEVSRLIGNKRYAFSKIQSPDINFTLCTNQSAKGDFVSYRFIECRNNGICSQPSFINITIVDGDVAPNAPALVSLKAEVNLNETTVTFIPQLEKVKSTMLYLYLDGSNSPTNQYTTIVPHIGDMNASKKTVDINITSEIKKDDTWCVKAKTVGLNGKLSEWSAPLCAIVEADHNSTLPWPNVEKNATVGKTYPVKFNADEKTIHVVLAKTNATTYIPTFEVIEVEKYCAYDSGGLFSGDTSGIGEVHMTITGKDGQVREVDIERSEKGIYRLPSFEDGVINADACQVTVAIYDENGEQIGDDIELDVSSASCEKNALCLSQRIKVGREAQHICDILSRHNIASNFVVYRQTVYEEGNSRFVQVSPLIEKIGCDIKKTISNNIKIIDIPDEGYEIVFEDRYPYVLGESYRYVLLFFNPVSGEPRSYSLTNPDVVETE